MKLFSKDQIKNIKAGRPSNLARSLIGFIWFYVLIHFHYENFLPFAITHFIISLVWFWFYEYHFDLYEKFSYVWYIPATLDIAIVCFFVYLSGTYYSAVVIGYIFIVTLSSVDIDKKKGLFVVIVNSLSFLLLIVLIHLDQLPLISIFSSTSMEKNLFKGILTFTFLSICCLTTNTVIYTVYKELKEKNLELAESLNNVRSLKFQQDGDYFLTSLLLEPLGVNAAKSKNVQIEFFTKQKKEFQFKKYKSEIGGDISISETILLQNKLYIVFFNGDAMGKSMQGAGGALVIGSAIKAIITRTQIEKGNLSTPSEWVKNCFIELQKVFETFDGSMLISGILGLIEDSSGKVYYLNAEHPSAVLYRQEKATILNEKFYLSKIGAPFFRNNFEVEYLELKNQDILILGSDGKDDLALDTENGKIINNDETRFLKIIEEEKAEISSIIKKLGSYGELIDDISLVKIQYTKTN